MKDVCCADCRYAYFERIYLFDGSWRDEYYCTSGGVLITIKDPNEPHNCSYYWPIS